jgi:signal peptide peptidase SppA
MNKPHGIESIQSLAALVHALQDAISEGGLHDHLNGRLLARHSQRQSAALQAERQGGIAVFTVNGVLSPEPEWYDETSSKALAEQFRLAAADDEIASGVMLIKSPGGYSIGMIDLANAAAEFAAAKPLVAHVDQMCCSAAYWLASQARSIYASIDAEIGSIGVRNLVYDFSKYFAELGVEAVATDTGPFKSLGVMGAPVTEAQRGWLKERVDLVMKDFTAAVRTGRKMSEEEFAAVGTGRTWWGEEAVALKLIDGIQTTKQTMASLAASSTSKVRSKSMSAENDNTPKAATLQELKAELPEATSDFLVAQQMAGATLPQAMKAWNTQLAAELKASKEAAAASEEKAKAAEAKAAATPAPGTAKKPVVGLGDAPGGEEAAADLDFREMAAAYQEKHKCRWSEATLAIKKKYPEAREAFGAPAKR